MKKIIVKDYDPQWIEAFRMFKKYYQQLLDGIKCDIQHVGSTAVEGLAAKPIIDMDIIVFDVKDVQRVIKRLEPVGYKYMGQRGITGRESFDRISEKVPYTKNGQIWIDHHLYCCVDGVESLVNHIKFRDYLKSDRTAVVEYSTLKKRLAEKYEDDIDAYVENKTAFIVKILAKSGMNTDSLSDITDQNKKKNSLLNFYCL